jgi:hypothetical protein
MGWYDDEIAERAQEVERRRRAIEAEGDARLRDFREGRRPREDVLAPPAQPAAEAPPPTWAEMRAEELRAEGLAKLEQVKAGTLSPDAIAWKPPAPEDTRPCCSNCGERIEVEDAHREVLGAMSPYPRVEWRCDPRIARKFQRGQDTKARHAAKRGPFQR